MLGCGIYGYFNGSPGKLLAPIDADGKLVLKNTLFSKSTCNRSLLWL
jgi:hypothetical protein